MPQKKSSQTIYITNIYLLVSQHHRGVTMHYYQFNIADYRKDTTHLLPIEHYIYRTLIDWYYLDEAKIPKETQVVLRRLGLGLDFEQNLVNVLTDFFESTESGYIHRRIEQQIAQYQEQVDKNRINGKLGGRPRKTQVVLEKNPTQSEINPKLTLTNNHKPITINQYKTLNDDFEIFWKAYPKKVGKDAARKAWDKAKPVLIDVLNALAWQIDSPQWFKNNGQYIPNPSTYLNQGRWQDEPTKPIGF